jgi:hypothetical protein
VSVSDRPNSLPSRYTFTKSYRDKMSDHWGLDLTHWWLPDNEEFPRMLRTIRSLVLDRSEGPPKDKVSEDLRDMRGIFFSLSLDDSARTPTTPSSTDSASRGKEKVTFVTPGAPASAMGQGTGVEGGYSAALEWDMGEDLSRQLESPDISWAYETQGQGYFGDQQSSGL